MLLPVTRRLRLLAAFTVAALLIVASAATPPEIVLADPGADQLRAASETSSAPGDRSNDRLVEAGAATPEPLVLPVRTPDGRLAFVADCDRCPPGHRDRIDRPPRSLA